jgi:transposase
MNALLNNTNRLKHEAQDRGETKLSEPVRQRIVAKGLALHKRQPTLKSPADRGPQARRRGNNLLLRLRGFQQDVLRFIADFAVPFTNNQAEQNLRMMKARMKISGSFRTFDGAQTFADIRSVISTARKHALNILDILTRSPNETIAQL